MGEIGRRLKGCRAILIMLVVEAILAGFQLLSRVVLMQDTSIYALLVYRNVVAAACIAPFAFFFERKEKKKLGFSVWLWIFLNALFGITMGSGMSYHGMRDTNAMLATTFLNLISVVTYVISVIVRMESLKLGTKGGKIKVLGAVLCLVGALAISLYEGKTFYIFGHNNTHSKYMIVEKSKSNFTRGTLFLVGGCLSYGAWFVVQAKLFQVFPLPLWGEMLTFIMALLQTAGIGLCFDRHKASWKLGWNMELVTIIYSGALLSALAFSLMSWVVMDKGPSFPAMLNPLALVAVIILEASILGEAVTVGRLLGMSITVVGAYVYLWGQNNEAKKTSNSPKMNVKEVENSKCRDEETRQSTAIAVSTA